MIITLDHINKAVLSLVTFKIWYTYYFQSQSDIDLKDLLAGRICKYYLILLPFLGFTLLLNSNLYSWDNLIYNRIVHSIVFYIKAMLSLFVYMSILSNIPNYIQKY